MIAKLDGLLITNIILHTTIITEKIPMNILDIQNATIAHSSLIDVESMIIRNRKVKYTFSNTLATLKMLGSSSLGSTALTKMEKVA